MNSKESGHNPRRAVLYARVSTRGQAEHRYSLRQQLEALREYAASQCYEILEEITDDYTGVTLEREGLDRVRDLVATGAVSCVMVQDRDRLARKFAHHLFLEQEFEKHGVSIRAINDWGDDSPEWRLMNQIRDAFAEYERTLIAERTRRGRLQRAKEGKIVSAGNPPAGYRYNPQTGGLEVDERTMPTVRRVFKLVGDKGLSLHATCRQMEAEGYSTPQGSRRWSTSTIRRYIKLDAYKPHTFEEVRPLVSEAVAVRLHPEKLYGFAWYNRRRAQSEEDHLAIPIEDAGIPRDTVERARKGIAENFRHSRADSRYWPLSGRVYCACGRALLARTSRRRGKRYYYYVCSKHNRGEYCEHGKWHRAEPLEARIFWAIWEFVGSPEDIKERMTRYIEEERASLRDPDGSIEAAYKVLEDIRRQRERFQEMTALDLITLDELKERLLKLEKRKDALEEELEKLSDIRGRVEYLENLRDNFSLMSIGYVRSQKDDDELMEDLYRDLEIEVTVAGDGSAEIQGIFGSQSVAPATTSFSGRP